MKKNLRKEKEILSLLDDYLQEANDSQKERVRRIKGFLDFLNYNLRLTELSKEEKIHFVNSVEGHLTKEMHEKINSCKTKEEKDEWITMWASSSYFRQCAWFNYLNGKTNEKPFSSPKKEKKKKIAA